MPLQHGVYVNNLAEDLNAEGGNTSPNQHQPIAYKVNSTRIAKAEAAAATIVKSKGQHREHTLVFVIAHTVSRPSHSTT
jgi:hypothetical protein